MNSMILNAAVNAISSVVIKDTYEGVKSIVKQYIERTTLLSTEKILENNIIEEVRKTYNWAYDDLFKNHKEHSDITLRYVHLDLLLEPRREHSDKSQKERKRPLKEIILANRGNSIILGQPGSGKTTSIKYIVNSVISDSSFLDDIYAFPIVIRLRELNKSNSVFNESQKGGIFEKLSSIFGLTFDIKHIIKKEDKKRKTPAVNTTEEDKKQLNILLNTKIIPYILDSQKILLILDGFDEIIDNNIKNLVISEITELASRLNQVNFILTSRSADFKLRIENTPIYEISELNDTQIEDFSDKWFQDSDLSEKFLTELYAKPFCIGFCTRPLSLMQLALIYSRTGAIPDKPTNIYQRIVDLFLKEWNEQQGVKRKTKYSTFTVERKREFLSNMAFNLKIKHNRSVFSKYDLALVYEEINKKFKELPIGEVEDVIEEIETHNGLILKSGYDSFEFSHLTIQEYLVADYILRSGDIRRFKHSDLLKIADELAIAVALSSEPSMFFFGLLEDIMFKEHLDLNFFNKFYTRILLEKPDFESNAIVIITLLSIYGKLCNKIQVFSNRQYLSSEDSTNLPKILDNKSEIEKIINDKVGEQTIISALDGYYIVDEQYNKYFSNIGLIYLKAIENNFNFPKNLFWINKDYTV